MLNISKDNSTLIKGIVIMMMLFYHLFNPGHIDLCVHLLHVGDTPLALWLYRACGPISFFLILSGYGLACQYEVGKTGFAYQLRRILRLFLHYWVVLAFFLAIGHWIKPGLYPGSAGKLLLNLLAWDVSYNAEMWFLFPYSVLSLFSFYIIGCVERIGNLWALIITIAINVVTSYLISRYGNFFYHNLGIYQPLLCFHLLQSFTMGVVLRRTSVTLNWNRPQLVILAAIAALVCITCMTQYSVRYIIYVPLMVILLSNVHWPVWLKAILMELGRKSMPIWMIHTWLAYYLFQEQVYALKYVPLIFLAVLAASYLLSIPVMWIAGHINRWLVKS